MKEYFVNLETRLKYKIVESDASSIVIEPAFSPKRTEVKLTWNEFYTQFKPLREPAKENEGFD